MSASTPLQAVLFDLDGTLIDAYPVHFAAYQYMFARLGIPIDEATFLATYTPNWYQTFEMMNVPREQWAQADAYWMEEAAPHAPALFPHTQETLAALAGRCRLGVVTSGTKSRVLREMAHTGILDRFEVVISGDDVTRKKPDPQGLELALEALGVAAGQAVYVGDARADWEMAQAAGVRFIGIPSRFGSLTAEMACEQIATIEALPAVLGLVT